MNTRFWHIRWHVTEISEWLFETYKTLIDVGVCPEQARMVLPQSYDD